MPDPQTGPQLALVRLIVERLSLSHREDWPDTPAKLQPTLKDVGLTYEVIGGEEDGHFLARLTLKSGGEGADYQLEATVSGVFGQIASGEGALTRAGAGRAAAAILFPYLREVVANVTMRGAFGMALLQPVNVVGLLEEAKAKPEAAASGQ